MLQKLKDLEIHRYAADRIDIRIEETTLYHIAFFQKQFHGYTEETSVGAFISVFANGRWYYRATTEIDAIESELHKLLQQARVSITKTDKKVELKETVIDNLNSDDFAYKLPREKKIEHLSTVREIVENDSLVVNPYVLWMDRIKSKYYINSNGVVYSYNKAFTGILDSYSLKENDDIFETHLVYNFQKKSALNKLKDKFTTDLTEAKLFLHAKAIEPCTCPVVLSPDATGIFTHESFGHKSEADFMIGDPDMVAQWEIGKKVANEIVSIIDCGDDPTVSGYFPIDDEGVPAKKNYLIKNGILAGRLHSEETAKMLNESVTGNAQAIGFTYEPLVRMTSTYIDKGTSTFEELIKPIEKGYFIKSVTHGSGFSTFTMAVNRAYKIENGKITNPVRMNVTTGTVFETLHNIDGVGDTVEIISQVFGGCGKMGQYPLTVSFGGPYIRIKSYNVS
ncbi:MAG: TldD/PmbA family protein [Candidatus Cloacimonetes bacterium]|nr:TldD/PmbA family protein [Candidatus Cloacimonadota bacterium]